MRGHAAGRGQDALGHEHAVDVVRHGLAADEDHRLALVDPLDRMIGREDDVAAGGARRRRQPPGRDRNLLPLGRIEARREQLVQGFRIDQQNRLFRRHQLLGDEIGRDHDGGIAGALAAARLQHIEMLVLDGELEVLDVLVVLLEPRGDLAQLRVRLGHHLLELADRLRRAHAGDDVLTLGVDQELAVELLRAGRRVAGEADAGAGAVAGVAEHHHLDVDRGADVIGDVVDAAVLDRTRVHPRPEYRVPRHRQLDARVLRKLPLRLLLDDLLVARDHLAQRGLVEVGVEPGAARLLDLVELVLERVLRDLEDDVAEHLDEAAVAVVGEAAVPGPSLQPLGRVVVQPEVEDGVHHAGHGELGTGADRDEQRVGGRAEGGAGGLLELLDVLGDLLVDRAGHLLLFLVVDVADLGRDREPRRHRQPGVGHLGEAGAFAAEQILHAAVAVSFSPSEEVDILPGLVRRLGFRCGLRGFRLLRHVSFSVGRIS